MIRIVLGCLFAILVATRPALADTPAATPDAAAATNAAPASPPAATNAAPEANVNASATGPTKTTAPIDTMGATVEHFKVTSPSMGRDVDAVAILPAGYADHPDKQYPILYAFHGVSARDDWFANMPVLFQVLKDKPMIIAGFDCDKSGFYVDAGLPQRWSREKTDTSTKTSLFNTFFFNEYIPALDKKYRINPKQRMLTGFSMGGYGAFHYMLEKPDMFCSVSSMSGAFMDMTKVDDKTKPWVERLYGPMEQHQAEYTAMDVFAQVKADAAKGEKLPPLRLRCGTEDKLVAVNRQMRDLLQSLKIPCEYEESPGAHNWAFWKSAMPDILDFHWRSLQGK